MQLSKVNYGAMSQSQAQATYYRRRELEILRYSQATHTVDPVEALFAKLDELSDSQIYSYMQRRLRNRKRGPAKGSIGRGDSRDVQPSIGNTMTAARTGSNDNRQSYSKQASDRALQICKEKLKTGERVDYGQVLEALGAGRLR